MLIHVDLSLCPTSPNPLPHCRAPTCSHVPSNAPTCPILTCPHVPYPPPVPMSLVPLSPDVSPSDSKQVLVTCVEVVHEDCVPKSPGPLSPCPPIEIPIGVCHFVSSRCASDSKSGCASDSPVTPDPHQNLLGWTKENWIQDIQHSPRMSSLDESTPRQPWAL